ncbi:hypothetical protein FGIG_08168 [Fasciola gigantica]|uniref:Rhodanese domain-containing protein n=1 Tax=Fasciola gigantica TaxID=46835 RepID=A0A504ZA33_FASGI|nr:hypothetical protein FGIG_08168 [Fasciola gigantica]
MTTCRAPRSAAPELRERLSLDLTPLSLIPTRIGYASAWGNCPLSAGPIPSTAPGWTDPFVFDDYEPNQPPQKRARTDRVAEDSRSTDVKSKVGTHRPTEPPLITCDELADVLCISPKCKPGQCTLAPIVLDLRSLPTQMFFRIKAAVGMPCESRVKMRLVLPHLDAYLHQEVLDICSRCQDTLCGKKRLVVLYTETGFEHSPVWEGLILHLTQNYMVDVKLLKGGFCEFRRAYSQLCEKTSGLFATPRTMSVDGSLRSASTPPSTGASAVDPPKERPPDPRSINSSLNFNSFLLPGLTFSFETMQGAAGGILSQSNEFPRHLVSPTSVRTPEFFFPTEDDSRTPKDVYRVKASRILPFLYLGNEIDCSSEQFLSSCRIRSVLNVTNKVPFLDEKRFRCCRLPAIDMQTQDLRPLFTSAFEFIEQSRQAGDSSPSALSGWHIAISGTRDRLFDGTFRSISLREMPIMGQNQNLCDFEADLISGRVPRKPDTLDGLITLPEESHDVDDFLSLSIENYTSTRASSVESVDDATNATVSSNGIHWILRGITTNC